MQITHRARLVHFRQVVYRALGPRKDATSDLLDAVLTAPGPVSLARLSLQAAFRRRWTSVSDALNSGPLDTDALRELYGATLTQEGATTDGAGRLLLVIDTTPVPKPAAPTSAERVYAHRVAPGTPQSGVVAGWEYQWLVALPEATGSWMLPLDVARQRPTPDPADAAAGLAPTALGLRQLQRVLALAALAGVRPVVLWDSGYAPERLAAAPQGADHLVRLRSNRVFYQAPAAYAGVGRPRRHGPTIRLGEAAGRPTPDHTSTLEDPDYGTVQVAVWQQVHAKGHHTTPFTLVQVQVSRLPRRAKPPAPLWLAWIGPQLPDDLHALWRWYLRRFTIEHGFRFLKRTLGWTMARLMHPAAHDRWTGLLAAGLWELWLARPCVADHHLAWERPVALAQLTPGRVCRACPELLVAIGSPARAPQPRGKSPGHPGPQPRWCFVRHPVVKRRADRRSPTTTRAA